MAQADDSKFRQVGRQVGLDGMHGRNPFGICSCAVQAREHTSQKQESDYDGQTANCDWTSGKDVRIVFLGRTYRPRHLPKDSGRKSSFF